MSGSYTMKSTYPTSAFFKLHSIPHYLALCQFFDTYSSPCSLLEELEERSDSEVKSQEAQLRILAKEKTSLVTKLTG